MLLSLGLLFTAYLSLKLSLRSHIIANNLACAAMQAFAVAQYFSDQTDCGQAEHAVTATQLSQ